LVILLYTVGRKKHKSQGEEGSKVTYDIRSKELKQSEEENRILCKLLINKEIELEVSREVLKKSLGPPIQERFSRCYFRKIHT